MEIDRFKKELERCHSELPALEKASEPSSEFKDKENELERKRGALERKRSDLRGTKQELNRLRSKQTSTSELFCPTEAQRKGISVAQIRQLIHENRQRFRRPPIGPIGEYIAVKDFDVTTGDPIDQQTRDKYIGVIQASLGNLVTNFLVETSADQQLFKRLCYDRFRITIPSVQFRYAQRKYSLKANPFLNMPLNPAHGPLLRISDLFEVKDPNESISGYGGSQSDTAWIFNTIITWSQCERYVLFGDFRLKLFDLLLLLLM